MTLKKQYPKPKEEITSKIRHRREKQKQEEAEEEIRDYLPDRQPTKSRSPKDR